ncbi:MAG TPA: DUF6797 domain-containing protein [Planctomycetota bacterium]|nr:DUF6797 domain-containing protein [Planctomycetota bacterium]
MQRAALLLIAIIAAFSSAVRAEDELVPGLVGEYLDLGSPPSDFVDLTGKKPTYVRVDKQVNFPLVAGDFHGIKMSDNFAARWTGILKIETAGNYHFMTESDDGTRLFINGKKIVDNGGIHAMQEANGSVDLKAGNHEIKLEYFEGGGEAGCILSWQPPKGKQEPIPDKVLFHKKGAGNIEYDKAAWEKRVGGKSDKVASAPKPPPKPGKFEAMEFGPYQTGTLMAQYPHKNNSTHKGLAIKLGADKLSGICFDTDVMRVSVGWTNSDGKFIKMAKGRDGLEGQPSINGAPAFGTKHGNPGWAKGSEWKDPRARPFGPLPADWAKYKGLYLHGDKVVVSYTVQGANVLEGFEMNPKDNINVFSRTLNIDKSSAPLAMLVFEKEKTTGAVAALGATSGTDKSGPAGTHFAYLDDAGTTVAAAAVGAPEGTTWEVTAEGSVHLKLPAISAPTKLQVLIASCPSADLPKFASAVKSAAPAADLTALTKGGPGRWKEVLTTQGVVGEDMGGWAMDVLTVPYDNPYNSYMRMTGVDFFKDGRAAIANIDGDVWIVSGIDAKLEKLEWKRYATGLFQALGLKIVDDVIYVTGRDQITRLHDLNNDGEADFYENFNNDCMVQVSYHEFAHDLHTDKDGNFYYMKGSDLGHQGTIHSGTMLKVSKDGSKTEIVAVGFRAPNGMGLGPNGELTTGDNQGTWTPSCPINLVRPGKFYGHVQNLHENAKKESPRDNPICWLPMSADNSSGGQIWAGPKAGPFAGHLFHMSYGKCLFYHVMYETVDGEVQGGVTKMPFTFPSGIMRGRVHPIDGQMYLSGMKGWQTSAGKDGCFCRVRYTGTQAYMPMEFHVKKTGIDITFSCALDPASATDLQNWGAECCNLKRTSGYGSDDYKPSDEKKKGRDPVTIKSVKLSADGKTVSLEIPEIKPVHQQFIKYKIKAADGKEIVQDLLHTINKVPQN